MAALTATSTVLLPSQSTTLLAPNNFLRTWRMRKGLEFMLVLVFTELEAYR
jgi:hypothetical protein